ncbi:unnamed protein product [Rotaria sp. Silwood2]|nr:unnamed protein product [Rotaria sp. Silwood2]CAF2568744.1 unnamed protein product [Rotaria sp. Silwood2]CAF3999068.1 unnamed protein product [Rotaria sp. Silwood2]CAF4117458.1 unnamed protein product [Rotaria sp. Silwood2]
MDAGLKAGQFSIYLGNNEDHLRYRIESFYNPMQQIELCTYPYNNVIGKLNVRQLGIFHEARFEILQTRNTSNLWFTGNIKRQYTWFADKYIINFAERRIKMRRRIFSLTFKFYNEVKKLIALFRMRVFTVTVIKYDVKIFSNEFPDSIYLLALAAHDNKRTKIYNRSLHRHS